MPDPSAGPAWCLAGKTAPQDFPYPETCLCPSPLPARSWLLPSPTLQSNKWRGMGQVRGQSLKPRAVSYLGIVNPACSRFLVADGSCLSCVRQINCFADRLHSIWASVSAMFMQLWIPVQVSSIWQGDEQIPGSPQHHFLLCQQSFAYPSLWAASLELLVELQSLWFSVQLALVAQPCSVPGGFSLLPCKVSGSNCFWECESSLNNKYLSCRSINLHGWLDGPCRCRCWGSIGRDLGTTAVTVSSILQSYPYRCAVILSTRII